MRKGLTMRNVTAGKLSIVFGGGIFAVALVGFVASLAGVVVPIGAEAASAALGMMTGARVA